MMRYAINVQKIYIHGSKYYTFTRYQVIYNEFVIVNTSSSIMKASKFVMTLKMRVKCRGLTNN